MMLKISYFICLFCCGVYLTTVTSYDDFELLSMENNTNAIDNIKSDDGDRDFVRLRRVKRAGPYDSTMASDSWETSTNDYTGASTGDSFTITQYNGTSMYIITEFTEQVSTVQTTSFDSQTPSVTSSRTTTPAMTSSSTTTNTTTWMTTAIATTSTLSPPTCASPDDVQLPNGSCIAKSTAQALAVNILRNNSASAVDRANGLSLYISSVSNATTLRNSTNVLSASEMDQTVANLTGVNITINDNTSFLMVQQPEQGEGVIVLGASFKRGIGGTTVSTANEGSVINSTMSAAAIVARESLVGVTSLNMVIIAKPTGFENADNSTNKTLASSVIIVNLRRNSSSLGSLSLSLYFTPLEEYKRNGSGEYLCSYYDTNASAWSEVGCTNAIFSKQFQRYECNCNHTTSFALIWLPQTLSTATSTKQFDAQDIASLVFQCVSILSFLGVLIHATAVRTINPSMGIPALNLLPLISTASTTVLFISYIALAMTVYTRTSSADQTVCFPGASVLMLITYFFLVFMFGVKVIAGYFYFLRFVRLFPQPSHRQLLLMLLISLLIALVAVSFAIGFNARSTSPITQLYPYKLCWFTRPALYYFMVIPIGMSLLFNIVVITLVSRNLFAHARNAPTSKQISERLKRCVIVLLSSCVTQGIGWSFGPMISFVNPIAGVVLGWFFILINGLEGLWSIIIYVLIRLQRLDEGRQVSAVMELSRLRLSPPSKVRKLKDKNHLERNRPAKVPIVSFDDLRRRGNVSDFRTDDIVF